MLDLSVPTGDSPTEIDTGFWVIVGPDAHARGAADRLRDACLHALDRGAQHLAVDVTAARTLSADLTDVLESANDVLRARGGSLVLWARETDDDEALVLAVGEDGLGEAESRLRAIASGVR